MDSNEDNCATYLDKIRPVWYLDLARPATKNEVYFKQPLNSKYEPLI